MTTEIVMRKSLSGGLLPVDQIGHELLAKIGKTDLLVTIKQPRNLGHHRKLFALLKVVYENQTVTTYATLDHLLVAIKIALGFYKPVKLSDGREGCVPDSIAFHSMSQENFSVFYDRVVGLVVEKILPGVKREDLEREILDLVGP